MPSLDNGSTPPVQEQYDWKTIVVAVDIFLVACALLFLIWKGITKLQWLTDDSAATCSLKAAFKPPASLPLPVTTRAGRPKLRYAFEPNWFTVKRPLLPATLASCMLEVVPEIYPLPAPTLRISSFEIPWIAPRLPLGLLDPAEFLALRSADEPATFLHLDKAESVAGGDAHVLAPAQAPQTPKKVLKKSTTSNFDRSRKCKENIPLRSSPNRAFRLPIGPITPPGHRRLL